MLEILQDSKSTVGGVLCVLGSETCLPISWLFQQQTSVSYSKAESEKRSLDAGLSMGGIPGLQFWDCVFETFSHPAAPGSFARPSVNRQSVISFAMITSFFLARLVPSNIPIDQRHSLIEEGNTSQPTPIMKSKDRKCIVD